MNSKDLTLSLVVCSLLLITGGCVSAIFSNAWAQQKYNALIQQNESQKAIGLDIEKKIRQVSGEKVPNQYIVVLKNANFKTSDVQSLVNEARAEGASIRHIYEHALKGYAVRVPNQHVLDRILSNPDVDYVEPDTKQKMSAQIIPTGVDRADGDLSSTKSGDGTGTVNVDIAILDSGIKLTHQDLNVVNHVECITSVSPQCLAGPVAGDDDNGHGTAVAGIAACKG